MKFTLRPAADWSRDLDLLGPRVRVSPLSWLLLLGGALAVVAMTQRAEALDDELARAQARYEHAERVQRALKNRSRSEQQVAAAASAAAITVPAADARSLDVAARVAARLAHPWADVLTGIEEAADGLALLRLDHDAASGLVQIEAAVRDDEAAWTFVENLAADAGRFAESELVDRELLQPAQGEFGLRVRVQVRVRTPDGVAAPASAAAGGRP